ncbi:GAF domain-containing protein [Robbsia sp. KACC 23696]|uniref:GAF domain-containing protein n=1 Tax=Robbsia sp. KACC 23696 TaxID=3149231 RepID=UPI00325B1DD5
MTAKSAPDDDPFVTTREAAALLGVSLKTAQVWLEQGDIPSWKTPGGHRRAKRSTVLALRQPPAANVRLNQTILIHRSGNAMQVRVEQLRETPYPVHVNAGDMLDLLIQVGSVMPALLIVELSDIDWQKFEMLRRIISTPRLSHTKIMVLSDLSERELRSELGATDRILLLAPDTDTAAFLSSVHVRLGGPSGANALMPLTDCAATPCETTTFITPANEANRMLAVHRSGLAGAGPEKTFDDLTRLAGQTLQAPICLLSILTSDQQWFKSHWGLDATQTPRAWSFCNHTIQGDEIFVVEDAASDERFKSNPLVVGQPNIRFYAGFPVKDLDGFPLGALCVIDRKPRSIRPPQVEALRTIATAVEDKINLRLRDRQLRSV